MKIEGHGPSKWKPNGKIKRSIWFEIRFATNIKKQNINKDVLAPKVLLSALILAKMKCFKLVCKNIDYFMIDNRVFSINEIKDIYAY